MTKHKTMTSSDSRSQFHGIQLSCCHFSLPKMANFELKVSRLAPTEYAIELRLNTNPFPILNPQIQYKMSACYKSSNDLHKPVNKKLNQSI